MATKAAKSITINSTKFELANALAVNDGKLQLKAKDVVLDEVEVGGSEAIFIYNHYDSDEGYFVTDAIKDIKGNTLTNAEACNKVKAGAQIYVQVVAASGSNFGQFQLLDKYEHEEYGGGSVVQEHFWSEGNAFNKYISMTFRLADNFVSAPNIEDNSDALFFRHVYDEDTETWSIEVTNAKGETITNKADAYAILEKGGNVYAIYPGGGGDCYEAMTYSFGDANGFRIDFERPSSVGANTVTTRRVDWFGNTPTWTEEEYAGHFMISKSGLTSLAGLAVGDVVTYEGVSFPFQQPLNNLGLTIKLTHNLQCKCISSMVQEYGTGTSGITFMACYNSEQYLIGIKKQNETYTIGSLKAL